MVARLVSVGDDFTLPSMVKVADGNLPERLQDDQLTATYVQAYVVTAEELAAATSVRDVIQARIDTCAAFGGGNVILPKGDYTLTPTAWDSQGAAHCLSVPSKVNLRGQGKDKTKLKVSTSVVVNTGQRLTAVKIGTRTLAASDCGVYDLSVDGSRDVIAAPTGGSVFGIHSMIFGDPALYAQQSKNVTIQGCYVRDVALGIGCTKNGSASEALTPERLATQFTNWHVSRNHIEYVSNKAVELAECNNSYIGLNFCDRVADGPQAIFSSHDIHIEKNVVTYTASGINVTEGSNWIWVLDNIVSAHPTATTPVGRGAMVMRTEPHPHKSEIHHVHIRGNKFTDQYKDDHRTLNFQTRVESTGAAYRDIYIEGNIFTGKVWLFDANMPSMTTIERVFMSGNTVTEAVQTTAQSACMVRDVQMVRNTFNAAQTLSASEFDLESNTFKAGLTLAAPSSKITSYRDKTPTGAVTNSGTSNTVSGTRLDLSALADPATLSGLVALYDADSLTAGSLTSWAPSNGSETAAFTNVGANAAVIADNSINGHKTVNLAEASSMRLVTTDFTATVANAAFTKVFIGRIRDIAGLHNLMSGKAVAQPLLSINGTQLLGRANGGSTAVGTSTTTQPLVLDGVVAVIFRYVNGIGTLMLNSVNYKPTATIPAGDAISGLRLGSSGSGNSPYPDADITHVGLFSRALTDDEANKVMLWAASKYGITLQG